MNKKHQEDLPARITDVMCTKFSKVKQNSGMSFSALVCSLVPVSAGNSIHEGKSTLNFGKLSTVVFFICS